MTSKLRTGLLFATAIGTALSSTPASAGVPSWMKKAVSTVSKTATSTVNTVSNGVNNTVNQVVTVAKDASNSTTDAVSQGVGYANFAAAQAKGYADTDILQLTSAQATAYNWSNLATADAASTAMGFRNYGERMAADSKQISQAEFAQIRTSALSNYSSGFSEAQNAYDKSRTALQPVLKTANSLANYVANTCSSSATSSWGKITPYVSKAKGLDAATQDALSRVLHTLARGSKPDQQTAADMLALGKALGMVTDNGLALVGNAYQSNFSVSVGGSGGWIGGANASVSFGMDTFPTNGKYNMAVAVNAGVQVAAGTADIEPGATVGFGLGWGPGSAGGAEGQTLTAGGTAGGVDVAAQWTVPPSLAQALATDAAKNGFNAASLKNALTSTVTADIQSVCQAPGISAGVSIPVPANMGDVTLSAGYTHVVWKGTF